MQTKVNREPTNTSEGVIDNSLLKVDLAKELGRGGFGVVYKAKYRGKDAAVKELLIEELSPSAQEEFESEWKIMLQLHDPSVVHLYGVTQEKPHRMVLEFCSLGSLDRYLQKRKVGEVSWEVRFHLATGIASGLHYLHTYNPIIIHGDLKSLNVFLTGDIMKPDVKLADFGLSKLKTETQSKSKTKTSSADKGFSIQWAAPELFSLKSKKTQASDMYAFGITLWEISAHSYPYAGCDAMIIRTSVISGERAEVPANTPASFEKVMTECWAQNSMDRPTAKVVLEQLQTYVAAEGTEATENVGLTATPVSAGFLKSGSPGSETSHSPVTSGFLNSAININARKGVSSLHQNTPLPSQTNRRVPVNSISSPLATSMGDFSSTTRGYPSPLLQPVTSSYRPFPKVTPVPLTAVQQVEAASQSVQNKIDPKELSALLKDVTEGYLVNVENRLRKLPALALGMGTVTDLSGRIFNDITVLQYAAWALDKEMCDLIMQYAGEYNSAIQLQTLWELPERYSVYGASYDITPLITKTETYLDNYHKWSTDECCLYWKKEVGGEQRKCPAWLIYTWCEEGKDVAWTKKDFTRKVIRESETSVGWGWWFSEGGVCMYPAVRGKDGEFASYQPPALDRHAIVPHLLHDTRCQKILKQRGMELLANLKTTSSNALLHQTCVPITTVTTTTANIVQKPYTQETLNPSVLSQPPKGEAASFPLSLNAPPPQPYGYSGVFYSTSSASPIKSNSENWENNNSYDAEYGKTLRQHGMELPSHNTKNEMQLSQTIFTPATLTITPVIATTTSTTATTTTANITTTPSPQSNGFSGVLGQNSLKPVLNSNQNQSSYSQQVKAMDRSVQDKINAATLSALLKWVTKGNLAKVEKLLEKNPSLALGTGTVTDLSYRTFNNITALQYAAWALDREMVELIMNYAGVHNSAVQLKAWWEEPAYYSNYGVNYDMTPLISRTKTYLENWNNWSYVEQCRCWQKEVGCEQRKCPAWLIYAWCEGGEDVAWTKKDFTRKIKREYDKNQLDWWFIDRKGVGSTWAAYRGVRKNVDGQACLRGFTICQHDSNCQEIIRQINVEFLEKLKVTIDSQLSSKAIHVSNTANISLGVQSQSNVSKQNEDKCLIM